MKCLVFTVLLLLASCAPSHPPQIDLSPKTLLAVGYGQAQLTIAGSARQPSIVFSGDSHDIRISQPILISHHWQATLTASVNPGKVTLLIRLPGRSSETRTLDLLPQISDSAGDGTPDFLRLDDPADQMAFRRWFTFLAEAQYFNRQHTGEISDCSALLRYAYREALRNHNQAWSSEVLLPLLPAIPSLQKYSFPHTPLGPNLFRNRPGTYSQSDPSSGVFSQFADAESLQRFNSFFISRDIARAQPGDLLFFRRNTAHVTYHSMIFIGPSQVNQDSGIYVAYHTGPEGTNAGEIRRLSVNQLLHFPDPQWQPIAANSSFLGIFRWNILKATS